MTEALTLDERLARAQGAKSLEQRLANAQAEKPENAVLSVSAKFRLPNGTAGTMTGETKEDVLRRIDVLRAFYRRCELTSERQDVLFPNGQIITGCPVGYTAQDIYLLADALVSVTDPLKTFPRCQQLQSSKVH